MSDDREAGPPPNEFFAGKKPSMTDAEYSLMAQWVRHESIYRSLEELRATISAEAAHLRKGLDAVTLPLWLIAALLAVPLLKSCAY